MPPRTTTVAPRGNSKKRTLDDIIESTVAATVAPPAVVEKEAWEQGHDALLAALSDVKRRFVEATRLAVRAIDEKWYTRKGFADAGDYFDDCIKFPYRTIARYVAIYRATRVLPEADQDLALEELAKIGVHRAAVIAPALVREPQKWEAWVKDAGTLKEPALQSKVSEAYGLRRAPAEGTRKDTGTGSRILDYILAITPPDRKEPVKVLFLKLLGPTGELSDTTVVGGLLMMCKLTVRDLADSGIYVEWPES